MCVCVAVLEAVQKWKTEKESRVSGEKQQEEEEEENIYTVYNDEVSCAFTGIFSVFFLFFSLNK